MSFCEPSWAKIFLAVFGMLPIIAAAQPRTIEQRTRQYISPDGSVLVEISSVGKEPGLADYESRIKFQAGDGTISCTLDYSSEDSEHGCGVVKAEWTPDSQYFVYSLASSGGHQAWHAPTQFLSRGDGKVRSLDDYFEIGITSPDFRIIAPNTIRIEVQSEAETPVSASVKLSALPRLRSWRRSRPFALKCTGSRIFRLDNP